MTEATRAIAEYNPIEAALAGVEKYRGLVCDVTTPKGLAEAKAVHKEVAALRIALEKTRKKVKGDVVARGKLIDSEAKTIFDKIAAIEDPIKAQIDAEERREAEAREAAIRAEAERLAKEEADRKAAEEKRLADDRAKNEAEARRLAEERAKAEAEDRARRQAIADEEAAAKRRIEAAEAEARAKRQAEEDRLAAERKKLDDEQRARDEAARKEREAQEARERAERQEAEAKAKAEQDRKDAEERERRRKVAEQADARTMIELFKKRFGHMPEYAGVIKAIDECLEPA